MTTVVDTPHPMDGYKEAPPCAEIDPEWWYPESAASYHYRARQAKELMCNGCPIFDACLEWAVRHEDFGVWAGTSASERTRIRRERGIRLVTVEPLIMPTLSGRQPRTVVTIEEEAPLTQREAWDIVAKANLFLAGAR